MAKRGLLLLNLGSPEAPTPDAVGVYLRQFLNDPFVIDIPSWLRWILVNWIIVPRRKHSSSEAYQSIWTAKGSPLVQTTKSFAQKVTAQVSSDWEVRWAMRYGQPSIESVLRNWDVAELYVVPLYPQYAESSTRTALEEVARNFKGEFKYLQDFFAEPEFIESELIQIQTQLETFKPDHLLLSFHGLPEHHLSKLHPAHCLKSQSCCEQISDANRLCYRAQCVATARALGEKLALDKQRVHVTFQSRLGNRPWIKPYTDHVVDALAQSGAKRLLVACPAFVTDCLETLEEIQIRLKEQFVSSGGEQLVLVTAPNDEAHWVNNFATMIQRSSLYWRTWRK